MTKYYNPAANLAFIHVSKNGGQERAHRNATGGHAFLRGPGKVKPEHLPLAFVRSHFPASWETLRGAHSFMLTREPRARFFSALLQRLRDAGHRRAAQLTWDAAGENLWREVSALL